MYRDHTYVAAAERHCAAQDAFDDRIAERANEIGDDAQRFLAWLAENNWQLTEVVLTSSITNRRVNARTALISYAPDWLREQILEAELVDDELLADMQITFANRKSMSADAALVSLAPEWLKGALVDWLSRQSQLEDEVRAEMWS